MRKPVRLPLALLALLLPGCVVVQEPAYQPYGYAPAVGPNAGAGAAVGALAGGLIGGAAAGRHDRGIGVVGGAAAGAVLGGLIGNGIDRDNAAAAQVQQGYAPPPSYEPQPYGYVAPGPWEETPPAY